MKLEQIFQLALASGYPSQVDDTLVHFKELELKECSYQDDLNAQKAAERAVKTSEGWQLLASQSAYDKAMLQAHIKSVKCSGYDTIPGAAIDVGKLDLHDISAIKERLLLIEMAAMSRHGLIAESDLQKALGNGPATEKEDDPTAGRQQPSDAGNDPSGGDRSGQTRTTQQAGSTRPL